MATTTFKVKSESLETHHKMVGQFSEMLKTWSSNKDGRGYNLVNNEAELAVEITARTV